MLTAVRLSNLIHFNIIFLFKSRYPSGLLVSGFRTDIMYAYPSSPLRTKQTAHLSLDLSKNIRRLQNFSRFTP